MMQNRRPVLVLLVAWMLFIGLHPAAAAESIDSKLLSDELVKLQGEDDRWACAGLFALGVQLGIPEAKLLASFPGAKLDTLPPPVLVALRQGASGIPAWIACLEDARPTGVKVSDLFGGGSSPDAKKLRCRDLAVILLASLLPETALKDLPEDFERRVDAVGKAAAEWDVRMRGRMEAERLADWFALASQEQRRAFLSIVSRTAYASAYPLIEADFLRRAPAGDDLLYLEIGAYCRHRRKAAADFVTKLTKVIRSPAREEEHRFFTEMWRVLTRYATLDEALAEWSAGRIPFNEIEHLVQISIDQPWAYHSMGIESVATFRPTCEANLRSLVAAAIREPAVGRRAQLLEAAVNAASLLITVLSRSDAMERGPPLRSDAPEWLACTEQLRTLLKDDRVVPAFRRLATPAERAAELVYELWSDDRYLTNEWDPLGKHWRHAAMNLHNASQRAYLVPAAQEVLAHPDGIEVKPYSEESAAALAAEFVDGNAVSWRKRIDALPWERKLELSRFCEWNKAFSARLWPRLQDFVEWSPGDPQQVPAGFDRLWRERLADKRIDADAWSALTEWCVAEAQADRGWEIVAESSIVQPGFSVYVFPASKNATLKPVPQLFSELCGDPHIMAAPEDFEIHPEGRVRVKNPEYPEELYNYPGPIGTITEQDDPNRHMNWLRARSLYWRIAGLPAAK